MSMTDHPKSSPEPVEPLDELVAELLDCGGVLSQIISAMVEFQAGGHHAGDQVPTPEIAYSIVRGVVCGLSERFSAADLQTSAIVVREVTEVLCNELYVLGPDLN
jgi:hypothetical protein